MFIIQRIVYFNWNKQFFVIHIASNQDTATPIHIFDFVEPNQKYSAIDLNIY